MKKYKIYSTIALISGLLLALVSVLVPIIKLSNYTAQNVSVGIIGGADASTLRFIFWHGYGGDNMVIPIIFGIALFLAGMFCLIFSKAVFYNCTVKTTLLSLTTSFFGASGLVCFFIWFSIVAFGEMSKHPISYPISIIGGAISLLAFIILIFFYIKARSAKMSAKGTIIDILTSITALPIFFLICSKIYDLIQLFV